MSDRTPLAEAYRRFRSVLLSTVVFSFCINLLLFVGPLYMLQIYDRVLSSRNENTLLAITAIALALLISYGLLEFVRSRLLVRAGMHFDEALSEEVYRRILRYQSAQPGGRVPLSVSDVDRLREFITGQGIIAFFDAPWVPLFLALCFLFHPLLGLVATGGAVLIFGLALVNELITRKQLQDGAQASQGASQMFHSTLQNAEVIRAMGMERHLSRRWLGRHEEMLGHQARASGRAGAILSATKFIRSSVQISILGVGAYLALQRQISPGIMIAASIVMGRALAPVEQAVAQWKHFVAARAAHRRLRDLFAAVPDEAERIEMPAPRGALAASKLLATIPGTRDVLLKNIGFGIGAGETLAIIGPSGCGKSTLVRHLVGAAQPASGTVRLDGTDMRHWRAEQLGRHMGYLSQDVNLFRGSVAENIARFDDTATDAEVVAAAQLAGAHEMVQALPQGYATEIGEGGAGLSGGQRQRIGLARAVFRRPSLVVLDEPNSNLDSVGEQALVACIKALKEAGSTVLLVTHRANLLTLSDKTLMLRDGAVEKFGPTREVFSPAPKSVARAPSDQQVNAAPNADDGEGKVAAMHPLSLPKTSAY